VFVQRLVGDRDMARELAVQLLRQPLVHGAVRLCGSA
jgi:hypothetical protein